jgi:hypothetical protein
VTPKPARHLIRWLLRWRGFAGVCLPPAGIYILAERMQDKGLIRHEQAHWEQYRRMGFLGFYVTYLWLTIRHGYWNNPMEVEARAAQHGPR